MKLTLLSMVQNILSSMDSDNVNTIGETIESQQVAEVIKETFYEIVNRRQWAFQHLLGQLEGVGDLNKPIKIKIPETFHKISCLKYRINTEGQRHEWRELTYLSPIDFLNNSQRLNSTDSNVDILFNDSLVTLYARNDKDPQYWTSFDDVYVWFDSYNNTKDSTIQQSKTAVTATKTFGFTLSDTFIPELPDEMFSLLLNEAKSTCHLLYKQQANLKAEQIAKRQYIKMREEEATVKPAREFVDYGKRTTSRGGYNPWWKGNSSGSGSWIEPI